VLGLLLFQGEGMTDIQKDALIGKAMREYAEARKNVALLTDSAKSASFIFRSLADAFDRQSPLEIVKHGENILFHLDHQKFDWEEISKHSLESLVSDLKLAIVEEKKLDDKRRDFQV
jgi:hypothetical protein